MTDSRLLSRHSSSLEVGLRCGWQCPAGGGLFCVLDEMVRPRPARRRSAQGNRVYSIFSPHTGDHTRPHEAAREWGAVGLGLLGSHGQASAHWGSATLGHSGGSGLRGGRWVLGLGDSGRGVSPARYGQVGEGWLWGSGPCAVPKDWLAGRAVSPQPGQVLGCQSLTIRRKNDMSRYPESGALASLLLVSNLTCVHINA